MELGRATIRVLPASNRHTLPLGELLSSLSRSPEHLQRLLTYSGSECRVRAEYHFRRYLEQASPSDLRARLGSLLGNAIFVSRRGRYSSNSQFSYYWFKRIAETAEELSLRSSSEIISAELGRHLPHIDFPWPESIPVTLGGGSDRIFRYSKRRHLVRLLTKGELLLRCASTNDSKDLASQEDCNELQLFMSLRRNELEIESSLPQLDLDSSTKFVQLNMLVGSDFYMFCASTVFDWRLFADFSTVDAPGQPEEAPGCLVIHDLPEFARRFYRASATLRSDFIGMSGRELEFQGRAAHYYDPFDSEECRELLENKDLEPFAKRIEYRYQHEYRFILKPIFRRGDFPDLRPGKTSKLGRYLLRLGSLEDIAELIELPAANKPSTSVFLTAKEPLLLSSAVGVTLPGAGYPVRFVYSVEFRERGRTDPIDLSTSSRFGSGGGSSGLTIDLPEKVGAGGPVRAIATFYQLFDIREHGNELRSFESSFGSPAWNIRYRAFLATGEPADEKLEPRRLRFRFRVAEKRDDAHTLTAVEMVEIDGLAYMSRWNGAGPLRINPCLRTLLSAEMEFIRRLSASQHEMPLEIECVEEESECPCSRFLIARAT